MRYVLDASVAAKWFNLEESSEEAVRAKDAHVRGDLELVAPTQIVYEVGNTIWRNPLLTLGDAMAAVVSLMGLRLGLFEPEAARVTRAMEIARDGQITFYDAAYIQVAEEVGAPLVTADKRQRTAADGIVETVSLSGTWL